MKKHAVLLSIPGLREKDLSLMPRLASLNDGNSITSLIPSFPCVTCTVQASMTTGVSPEKHGVIANGFYWRDKEEVEMWTAWNKEIQEPQIWDHLHKYDPEITSAVWFPLLSKGAKADYICTPAPIHNPDGSESLWCYTIPEEMYGTLKDELGHFPLMNFWGPLSSIKSTTWIIDSAIYAAKTNQPNFFYIYLPHLDYAAQKFGPDSPEAINALSELDQVIGKLIDGFSDAGMKDILWLASGEYTITEVTGVGYPNRILREAGMLDLRIEEEKEYLAPGSSTAFAMVDHQIAHIFVNDADKIKEVANLFQNEDSVEQVLVGEDRDKLGLNHERSGEIILVSKPDQWFAYYWWMNDGKAPGFARTVDIHQKPGYDPVEMFINLPEKETPLDATLVKGSHGYPANDPERKTVILCSDQSLLNNSEIKDTEVAKIILKYFSANC
jgi:predicted AlkP superfamily pyrophosphatase or phosphodiesterase